MKKIIAVCLVAVAVVAHANNTYYGFNSQDMADNLVNVSSFGAESASLASHVQFTDFIGEGAGYHASNVTYTVAIGDHACEYANNLHRSVAIGQYSLAGRSGRDLTDINGHFYANGLANAFLIDPSRTNSVRTAPLGFAKGTMVLNAPTGVCINAKSLLWNGNPIGGTYMPEDALVIEDYVRPSYSGMPPQGCKLTYYYDRWTRMCVDAVLDDDSARSAFEYSWNYTHTGTEATYYETVGTEQKCYVTPTPLGRYFTFADFEDIVMENIHNFTNKTVVYEGSDKVRINYFTSKGQTYIAKTFDMPATNIWAVGGPQPETLHVIGLTVGGVEQMYEEKTWKNTGTMAEFRNCPRDERASEPEPFVEVRVNFKMHLSGGRVLSPASSICSVYGVVYDYISEGGSGYNTNIIQRLRSRERAVVDMDSAIAPSVPASTKYVTERTPHLKVDGGFLYVYDAEERAVGKIPLQAP